MQNETITLQTLNNRIGRAIAIDSGTQNVWVTAELSDVSVKNGHTYMELIEKDSRGMQVAKARAMIWRSSSHEIMRFQELTGQKFCSGIKLKVLASATMHPLFGLSLTITEIDPAFTMGDLLIKRREILERLKKEGVLEDNRNLTINALNLRIAVISAPEAAGYGDFCNHLSAAGIRYRYRHQLFPAVMQGEKTVTTVLAALEDIENCQSEWDCVVIIRGGGATSDLAAFESYELAYRIATFPIPVIVGIGHERDITVLDYVANTRVKTPTAAADFLIQSWDNELTVLQDLSRNLIDAVREKVGAENMQLSYFVNNLNIFPLNAIEKTAAKLDRNLMFLESQSSKIIAPQKMFLSVLRERVIEAVGNVTEREKVRIQNISNLLKVLSPASVLKRGYTMTVVDGKILKSAKEKLDTNTEITTIFHDGKIISTTI